MSQGLIILTGLIYAYIAAEQAVKANYAIALMFAGYAVANIGVYFQAR